MAKKKESSARKQTAFKKRPMKTPEFVESVSGESVVREVIDSSESSLNYRDGASGSSEELSAKSGVPVESRTHPRDYQADSPSRGQKVRYGSGSISDPEQRTHLNNELIIQSPRPDIELTDVRPVSMMKSRLCQIKVPSVFGIPYRMKGHLIRSPTIRL